jgi:hypothetical protein
MLDVMLDFMLDRVHAMTHVALRASSSGRCIELADLRKGDAIATPVTPSSRPWMGAAVDLKQSLRVDRGINLRRR